MPDYKGGEIKNTAESTSKYKIKKIDTYRWTIRKVY